MDLFDLSNPARSGSIAPLAYRMRPRNLDELQGQVRVVGPGTPLRRAIEKDQLGSLVLYGPPGTGKTSIAQIIAAMTSSHFESVSPVTAGVNDIKRIAAEARDRYKFDRMRTILFVDEIHRFNKSQQDVLLPFVEDGTLTLIGATTENPLYELNNALLSRVKLYVLETLDPTALSSILDQALHDTGRGLGQYDIILEEEAREEITRTCKGDARMALNIVEAVVNSFLPPDGHLTIDRELLARITMKPLVKYDRSGDYHYDTISAFIKSIRGSDPDAALFWLAAMLEGGEDSRFIARRLIVHAAEDIGLADPFALTMATSAADAVQFVGMPEARIPLAEATIYLATAPKSNSSKTAIDAAMATVRQSKSIKVPLHLADTSHSQAGKLLGHGQGYKYPPAFGGYVNQRYLPEEHQDVSFYHPSTEGYEEKVRAFLARLPRK